MRAEVDSCLHGIAGKLAEGGPCEASGFLYLSVDVYCHLCGD